MKLPAYLDYNATTPLAAEVLEAILPYFSQQFGNAASRSHVYGWQAKAAVEQASETIAKALDCKPSEIVYTSGATESINLAIKGIEIDQNKNILSSPVEHKASLDVLENLDETIEYVDIDERGQIVIDSYLNKIQAADLVSLIWANNETGIVWDIPQLVESGKKVNADCVFHADATQAVGKIPVSFQKSGLDMLSMSGHKIYGPKGIGLLLVKEGTKLQAQIQGGGHQKGRRSGTLNVPLIVGMAKACELISQNTALQQGKVKILRDRLETALLELPGTKSNSHGPARLPNTLNISFEGVDGEQLIDSFTDIAVSTGSACTSASVEPSHVLKAIQVPDHLAYASIRFSLGIYSEETDVERAIAQLKKSLNTLRA